MSDVSEPVTWDRIGVVPGQAAMRIGTAAQVIYNMKFQMFSDEHEILTVQ